MKLFTKVVTASVVFLAMTATAYSEEATFNPFPFLYFPEPEVSKIYQEKVIYREHVSLNSAEFNLLINEFNFWRVVGGMPKDFEATVNWVVSCAEVDGIEQGCGHEARNPTLIELEKEKARQKKLRQEEQEALYKRASWSFQDQSFFIRAKIGFFSGFIAIPMLLGDIFWDVNVWEDDDVGFVYILFFILGLICSLVVLERLDSAQ